MHPQAWQWVAHHATKVGAPDRVMDQGGQNVNGSIRVLFPTVTDWTAVDMMPGAGVDLVADCGDYVHPDCDLVVSTELLEHTPRGADFLARDFESLKPCGHYIDTTAAPGRAPHSALGEHTVPPGEHYANIPPGQLRDWLEDAGFVDIVIDEEIVNHDTRAWARRPGALHIVTVAYRRPHGIHVLLNSFLAQTSMNWTMHIVHDGPDEEMERIFKEYATLWPRHISYEFTDQRHNDWGHTLRDLGIRQATGPYLLITNDDNYYAPIFVQRVLEVLEASSCDGALVDMVHSHPNPGDRTAPAYSYFQTEPRLNRADIGCVVIKTTIAQEIGFRDRSFGGDGTYIEDASKRPGFRWAKIPQVLFVHN